MILLKIRTSKTTKVFSVFLVLALINTIVSPTRLFALTNGPTQPEVASFEPFSTNQMVDLFSGDFTYNIPLFELPGPEGSYPFNLAYHSGITMDQEASWVGLGWTLNPGAINRSVRGFPDDFKGDEIIQTLDQKPNHTFGFGASGSIEIFGADLEKLNLGVGLSVSNRFYYNNYKGFGYGIGVGLSASLKGKENGAGGVGLNLGLDLDSQSGASVDMGVTVSKSMDNSSASVSLGLSMHSHRGLGLSLSSGLSYNKQEHVASDISTGAALYATKGKGAIGASTSISFADNGFSPVMSYQVTGIDLSGYFKLGVDLLGVDPNLGGNIFWSTSYLKDRGEDVGIPVYGYNHLDAPFTAEDNEKKERYLLDYKRDQDGTVTPNTPNLAMTSLTYDYYNIQGQGVGGMFRPFRSKIGHVHEPYARSANYGGSVGVDLGVGQTFHLGFSASYSQSVNKTLDWNYDADNKLANYYNYRDQFEGEVNPLYENYYYKVHGERTLTYPTEKKFRVPSTGFFDAVADFLNPLPSDIDPPLPGDILSINDVLGDSYSIEDGHLNYYTGGELAYIFGEEAVAPVLERKELGISALFNPIEAVSYAIDHTQVAKNEDAGYIVLKDENGMRVYTDEYNEATLDLPSLSLPVSNNSRVNKARMPRNSVVIEHINSEIEDLNEFKIEYNDLVNNQTQLVDRASKPNHHVGGFSTISGDGKRYVYGLPAYNNVKRESIYTVDVGGSGSAIENIVNTSEAQADYEVDNTDKFLSITETPDYAYAYMLTSVLGADYVDSDGVPGPSSGDMGYWIKFNYKLYDNDYGWRAPYEDASFIPGMESFREDDKASFTYGEKEVYYLESVESSTHIAIFDTDITTRTDGYGATEFSGKDPNSTQLSLDQIRLYTKAEYQDGTNVSAVPIKTVHLNYNNNLVPGVPNSYSGSGGKLTLESLYFTYLNSNVGSYSKYIFGYDYNSVDGNNYAYQENAYDRWGNYVSDDEGLSEYEKRNLPYTTQFSDLSDEAFQAMKDAETSAWHLNKITMPTGGEIDINYESDDYAYVQHRKATQMFKILGLGPDNDYGNIDYSGQVYQNTYAGNLFVFFELEDPITNSYTFKQRYLEPLKHNGKYQLYFKIKSTIREPGENFKEWLSAYAEIDMDASVSYGTLQGGTIGYLKLKPVEIKGKSYHPFALAAWQFIRSQKPQLLTAASMSNADPDSDMGKLMKIKSLLSIFNSLSLIFKSYTQIAYNKDWGSKIDLNLSRIKLGTPDGKKYGGNNRVKSITVNDNYNSLFGDGDDFIQGQAYDYTIEEEGRIISSGVANYEPMIGGDENPLKHAKFFNDGIKFKTPDQMFFEYPINESYYPGASVGYRKVTVTPISSFGTAPTAADISKSGISEYKFYTSKDFPVFTGETNIDKKRSNLVIPLPLIGTISFHNQFATQGYKIILNDMHGKAKSEYHYAQDSNGNKSDMISGIEYIYNMKDKRYDNQDVKEVVSDVPVLLDHMPMQDYSIEEGQTNWTVDQWKLPTENMWLGVEHEFFFDNRNVRSYSLNAGLDVNTETMIFGPIIIPLFVPWPNFTFSYRELGTMTSNKVITKTGVLSKTIIYNDKSQHMQENVLYDKTGEVLLTKMTNSFEEPVYQYSLPAHKVHENMGAAYKRLNYKFKVSGIEALGVDHPDQYKLSLTAKQIEHLKTGDRLIVKFMNFDIHPYLFNSGLDEHSYEAWVIGLDETLDEENITVHCEHDLTSFIPSYISSLGIDPDEAEIYAVCKIIKPIESNQLTSKISEITALEDPTTFTAVHPESGRTANENLETHLALAAFSNIDFWTFIPWENKYVYEDVSVPYQYEFENDSRYLRYTDAWGTWGIQFWTYDGSLVQIEKIIELLAANAGTVFELNNDNVLMLDPDPAVDEDEIYVTSYVDADGVAIIRPTLYNLHDILSYSRLGLDSDWQEADSESINPYITGEQGVWRPKKTYQYYSKRKNTHIDQQSSQGRVDLKKDGTMETVPFFEWLPQSDASLQSYNWVKTSELTKLDQFGNAIESKGYFGRYSSILYDNTGYLVRMQAQNARADELFFEDFENTGGSGEHHTGKLSQELRPYTEAQEIYSLDLESAVNCEIAQAYYISVWLKQDQPESIEYMVNDASSTDDIEIFVKEDDVPTSLYYVNPGHVKVDGWIKYDFVYNVEPTAGTIMFEIKNNTDKPLFIDDIKILPKSAKGSCYVYDISNHYLLSILNETHYASFYSYDEEGNLFLIKQETSDGVKMVQESRKHAKQ